MKCSHCGFDNDTAGKFCGSCGTPLPVPDPPEFHLATVEDSGQIVRTTLNKPVFYIGRSHDCDLVIPHASISRQHALISSQGGVYYLEDLRSKNGVLLNHHRVLDRVEIRPGDEIQFGDIEFTLEGPPPAPGVSPAQAERPHPATNLEILLEISKLINSSLILPDVLEKVMASVMDLTRAQRGILLIAGEDGRLEIKVARNLDPSALTQQQFQISQSSVERVFKSGQSFISVDIDSDSRISAQQSIMSLGLKTVLCVPLKHRGKVRGVIYVDSHNVTKGFSDGDLQMLEALADHASIAIENARLVEENNEMFFSTIEALAEAIEKRDPYTGGHTRRVLEISLDIAAEMGLRPEEREVLKLAALLHDIGKIGIDDQVLRKQGSLTEEEFRLIMKHPEIGCEIVKHIRKLSDVLPVILMHHEKMDGTGYPLGRLREQIPLTARIVAVADAYDAMVSDRPYRKGLGREIALAELDRVKGVQFDPDVVEAFMVVLRRKQDHHPDSTDSTFMSTLFIH
jgi:putative nucleotidyltransferase with HDIG domain